MRRMRSNRVQQTRVGMKSFFLATTRLDAALTLALIAAAASSAACVRSKSVVGPDGTAHQLIKCPGGLEGCLKKATRLCPSGYEIVSRGTTVPGSQYPGSSETELLVRCKTDPAVGGADSATPKFSTGKAPEGALGYRFKINTTAAEKRCESQGFESGQEPGGVRCSGIPKALSLDGFVDLKFCEEDLCEVNVVSPVEVGEAQSKLSALSQRLEVQYGPPGKSTRFAPPVCAGDRLPACVADGRAALVDEWIWKDGPQIVLSLHEHKGGVALRISYRVTAKETKKLNNVEGL